MKKKLILSSLLSIVVCLSLICGSTMALFTSESKVNVAVTSGTVKVTAAVDGVTLYSMGQEQTGAFENGGTATINAETGVLSLSKMTPGDSAKVTVSVKNESNVFIKYRIKLAVDGTLAPALKAVATINSKEYKVNGGKTLWTATTAAYQAIDDITVTIDLPVETGDEYQDKTADISILVEAVQGNATVFDWDGTADTSWYNDTDTEFTLSTPEAVAGLSDLVDGGNTFAGKTIKLDEDINLYTEDANGNPICFDPIGSYRYNLEFQGTFDGQGHTVSNMSQNTWALNNGYAYSDLGMGLFGKVRDAKIKDLTMDGAEISGESGLCGVVTGAAYGECTFENVTVSNSKCNDYQYYAGGIVGWASGKHQFIGCTVDSSTTIGGQWGDFGNCSGGVIGGIGSSAEIVMKDCVISCVIDAVNDIVSAYQWGAYRNCGMLIGSTTSRQKDDQGNWYVGPTAIPNLTCENVTVIYGEWAKYTYCEFGAMAYPYVRVQAGVSVDAYINIRGGHPTDANGNTVVDDNHVHNEGEEHHKLIVFDQLYGGAGNHRYCNYGIAEHTNVTVVRNYTIDSTNP